MKVNVYQLKCLTNLHMGSGDINYSVIDLEVERDPVTGEPTMNASGVKGAIRDFFEKNCADYIKAGGKCSECMKHGKAAECDICRIFGSTESNGEYKFFSGDLLGRPVRVTAGKDAYAIATTPTLINSFVDKVNALAGTVVLKNDIPAVGTKSSGCDADAVEGMSGLQVASSALLTKLLGDKWVVGDDGWLKTIGLPVVAHNVLNEKKKSKSLWFEEYVPHESVFGLIVMSTDDKLDAVIANKPVIQFGAEASTGCGYVQLTKVEV